jgi:hypothetical protein
MSKTVLELSASSAKGVGSGPGAAFKIKHAVGPIAFTIDATAESGTSPTADVDIEVKDEVSGKWIVILSFTQVTAVVTERLTPAEVPEGQIRAAWVIGGSATPTQTFSVSASYTTK